MRVAMTRLIAAVLAFGFLCVAAAPGASARSDEQSRADVQKFYDKLEKVLNSDAFQKDPSLVLPFFDTDNMILYDAMLPGAYICLGHTESMSRISTRFQMARFPEAIVYRRPKES